MEPNISQTQETLATYLDRWLGKAATGGLRNPLLKMPVKRFRILQPAEFTDLQNGRSLVLGTSSDPIARNLYKNYDEKIRERGEQTGFLTIGSVEVILAGAAANGGKRSALMPVWLQRIDLRKKGENIHAVPSDEPIWDLNPELPAILQPLGIDTRKGPHEDQVRLLQWLSAQVGNRGRVDTTTSYVGCFSSQHLVIRERLADGRWRRAFAQNHAIVAKLFGTIQPTDTPQNGTTGDAKIEDLGLALPIDDSQLRVIQLADAGQSLVVQGPPGTGKSQTIANLVANALWRGKRVLVVCDKRTAIRQVEERLVKCNLGSALLNLHDEGLDKKAFLQQASDVFPSEYTRAGLHPVDALAEQRNELNQRVHDGNSVVHPALGISCFNALAGLIQLREKLRNAPNIDIANWSSLSRERLNRLFGNLSEWESLSPVAANHDPIWNTLHWSAFRGNPNARIEVLALTELLGELLAKVVELRENAAVAGFDDEFEDLCAVRELAALALLVGRRPRCHATILDDLSLSVAHLNALEEAQRERTDLLARGHPLDLKSGPLPASRDEAQEILRQERATTWEQLSERVRGYQTALSELSRIDSDYARIATQRGWNLQKRQSERVAQMAQASELLATQVAIPSRWWSQTQGSPKAGLAQWHREMESLANHGKNAGFTVDLAALARVAEKTWPDFQAIAEDGFNAISYCLRFRNDRRVKLALKQIYPQLPLSGDRPWLDLVLHAVKAREILTKIRDASVWHFDLSGLTETCLASAPGRASFFTEDYRTRFEALERAADLTERLRLRNDLFFVENPVWSAHWETAGLRQVAELEQCLCVWKEWVSPNPADDDVDRSRIRLEQRIGSISGFLDKHATADGDHGQRVLQAWDDHSDYVAKTKKLEELKRYQQITEDLPESVKWSEVRSIVTWRDETRSARGSRRLDLDHQAWKQLGRLSAELDTSLEHGLKNLEQFFHDSVAEGENFPALALRLRAVAAGMPLLDVWCRKAEWSAKVAAWPELQPFWTRLVSGFTPTDQVKPLFCYNLLRLTTPLVEPHGPELAAKLKAFVIHDEQLEKWSITELRSRLAKKQGEAQVRNRMGFAEIQRLATLGRIRGTIRELCQAHLPLLLDLKPAWLMSPVSLANLIDLQRLADEGQPFDLVIFDEASQIPVNEGLLPLGFAKQTIIVGDDKQLPPTSFFTTSAQSDDEEPEELGESESLIEEFVGSLPSPMLMAHYRSETPDLISFSNREFYEGKLEMYPPVRVAGIGRRCHLVPNGVFDSGRSRTNLEEAKAVVRLVEDHVRNHRAHSLGVVAMNAEQMDLIESLLVSASVPVREFCADEEQFFIRNLETVQGDEMDRIIVSLTYGKNPSGSFNAAILGPLVRKGGHRRLNVALSRSRSGMIIVTSMDAAMLALSDAKSDGFACLRRLLEELETSTDNQNFGIAHKRFEKRRDGVSEVVYCESPFEEQVVEFLENRGIEVRCQFGVQRSDGLGSFRIDIVVVENGYPLLAVECDGAAYHRSLSARTRDRARQSQLEKLGWKFHRVWSTNWWLFPDAEKEALVAAISAAQRQASPVRPAPAFGSTHSVSARPPLTTPSAPLESPSPKPASSPPPFLGETQPIQASLLAEMDELFQETPKPPPKVPVVSATPPAGTQPPNIPTLLQYWSRLPGWPEAVIGRRVQWKNVWGRITRTERGGKSLFFREEQSGQELELSADFIRMRCGSDQ